MPAWASFAGQLGATQGSHRSRLGSDLKLLPQWVVSGHHARLRNGALFALIMIVASARAVRYSGRHDPERAEESGRG